jgi:hypothetical protein
MNGVAKKVDEGLAFLQHLCIITQVSSTPPPQELNQMSKIKCQPIARLENQMSMLDGMQGVFVDGIRVGTIGKNKYGIWIGNFDTTSFTADNPFAAARISHSVKPSALGRRRKADVVKDIAAGRVGEYEAFIHATSKAWKLIRDGHLDRSAYHMADAEFVQVVNMVDASVAAGEKEVAA